MRRTTVARWVASWVASWVVLSVPVLVLAPGAEPVAVALERR